MNVLLITMLILTILLTVLVIGHTILTPITKEKKSFTMFMVSVFMFQIGYLIEITTFEKAVVMAGVKVQYVAISLILVFLVWFISEFCRVHTSFLFYLFQFIFGLITVVIVFTSEMHHLMYLELYQYQNEPFALWKVKPGPFYSVFYLDFSLVFLFALYYCSVNLLKTRGLNRKRSLYILSGTLSPVLCLCMKSFNLTQGYDLLTFGLFVGIIFYYMAIIKLGYFNSLQAANVNIINHCKEGLLLFNVQNELLFSNPVMESIIPDLKIGMNVEEIKSLKDVLTNEETLTREIRVGESIYEIRVEVLSEYGYQQGKLVWFIDLTQNYEYINQLKRLKKYAEEENQEKSLFFARMSHEIRTPMNVILGMDEMILRETESENIRGYAENIKNVGSTLISLINDLLDLTKMETGKMEIHQTEYQVCVIINDIINMSRAKILEKNLKLKMQINPNLPSVLYGDEIRIRQVFLNIINNAIKYTERGQVTFALDYESYEDDSITLVARISDTGIGIKQEDMTKLFFEFQRLDPIRNRNVEGSGLGLIITKQLLNMMGGSISLESEYGKGSIFTIRLKQKVVLNQKIGYFDSQGREIFKKAPKFQASFTAKDCKILVLDDSQLNLEVVKGLLKDTLIQVDTALSGKECLEKVKKEYYHLLLIDQMMPEMSGTETMLKLRELFYGQAKDEEELKFQKWYQNVPAIVFTADHINQLKENFREFGFSDYIPKPITPTDFEDKIRNALSKELIHIQEPVIVETEDNTELPVVEGLDLTVGLHYLNHNREKYLEVLQLYLELIISAPDEIYELTRARNWKDYTIFVHGIKSASIQVGATKIQKAALRQEQLAKEEKEEEILLTQIPFIMEMKQLSYNLSHTMKVQKSLHVAKGKKEPITTEELRNKIQSILQDQHLFEESVLRKYIEELLIYEMDGKSEEVMNTCLTLSKEYEIGAAVQLLQSILKME